MAEYIERKAAHDLVRALERFRWRDPETGRGRDTLDYDQVQFGIDKIKACDVQPVRHGRWIVLGQRTYGAGRSYTHYCNECGQHGFDDYKCCPNCGAKMDGDNDA